MSEKLKDWDWVSGLIIDTCFSLSGQSVAQSLVGKLTIMP
jgi:hypothetical protein